MKGIAMITVTGKDGKIKLQRRENNTITTAHQAKQQAALKTQVYGRGSPNTGAFMFQGIQLHSEQLEDMCDIEPVMLCGAKASRKTNVTYEYSPANKTVVDETTGISTTWVWVLEKSCTIRAISLHSSGCVGGESGWVDVPYPIRVLPNNTGYITNESNGTNYRLKYATDLTDLKRTAKYWMGMVQLQPLYDSDHYVKPTAPNGYIFRIKDTLEVIDINDTPIRSFSLSQFSGLAEGTTYYCRIMPTAAADWLFVGKSSTEIAVYKIPRSTSEETISLVTTIEGTGFETDMSDCLVISNCFIANSTSQEKIMFSTHSDGTYSIGNGQMINGVFAVTKGGYQLIRRDDDALPTLVLSASELPTSEENVDIGKSYSGFVHNTILNISSPISLESGDTLTITYNIKVEAVEPILPEVNNVFETDGWDAVSAAIADGTYKTKYHIGEEKTIELTSGELVTLQILGFDHDDLADGTGKAPITLGMKHLLSTTVGMNTSNTNSGGWTASKMRTVTIPDKYAQLPADLKEMVKTVKKKTSKGSQSSEIVESEDTLFLFSEVEIAGERRYSVTGEGEQYDYWKKLYNHGGLAANRIKKLSNGSGNASYWWLRSPCASYSSYFCSIYSSGEFNSSNASYSYGVCFGFCI